MPARSDTLISLPLDPHRPPEPDVIARIPPAAWFVVGCLLVGGTQLGYVALHGWDATILLHVGDSPARPLLEREFGHVALLPGLGHDGKYFYLVARHPNFARADAELLDAIQDPGYRYGRPLYPLVAGLGGTLSPWGTLAGLIVVQVLAGGACAAVTAALARRDGLPLLAVAVGLANPGIYSSGVLLTSDLPALTFGLAGVLAWQRGRAGVAVALFCAAVLTKEYHVLTPLVLAATAGRTRATALLVAVPLLCLAAWKLIVASAVGFGEGGGNFGWPGVGIVESAPWWDDRTVGALAVALVGVSLAAVVRRSRPLPRWQCVAWGLVGLMASDRVWINPADLLRAIGPAWWFTIAFWWPARS